jgi:Fic family protein
VSKKAQNLNICGWKADSPYNALPELPPAAELETKAILRLCIKGRAALAELKAAANIIPNQGVLINTLPKLEAQASTEIENIVTTTDKLFEFQDNEEHADPATTEALQYNRALLEGYKALNRCPLNAVTAETVCTTIKNVEMRVRNIPGTALRHRRSGAIIYTPPVGEERLRGLLTNWEMFLHDREDLDPLIRMAVGHYQFEAIHPFTDGNGRTGRVLNSLFLIDKGLLELPILYLSRFFIKSRDDYYRLLLGVTRGAAWEEWILFVLQGVEETAGWTLKKVTGIQALLEHTKAFVRHQLPKVYSHELVQAIFEQPYCRINDVVNAGIAKRQTASMYLKGLAGIGVLREVESGRDKVFVHPKLMQLLTRDDSHVPPYLALPEASVAGVT